VLDPAEAADRPARAPLPVDPAHEARGLAIDEEAVDHREASAALEQPRGFANRGVLPGAGGVAEALDRDGAVLARVPGPGVGEVREHEADAAREPRAAIQLDA